MIRNMYLYSITHEDLLAILRNHGYVIEKNDDRADPGDLVCSKCQTSDLPTWR